MKQTLYQWCAMLLMLLANANQCLGQLPLNQFKPLSDSAYQAVPEYQSGNKYQKDAILFMDMVDDKCMEPDVKVDLDDKDALWQYIVVNYGNK